jgi:hypothetical protein
MAYPIQAQGSLPRLKQKDKADKHWRKVNRQCAQDRAKGQLRFFIAGSQRPR